MFTCNSFLKPVTIPLLQTVSKHGCRTLFFSTKAPYTFFHSWNDKACLVGSPTTGKKFQLIEEYCICLSLKNET